MCTPGDVQPWSPLRQRSVGVPAEMHPWALSGGAGVFGCEVAWKVTSNGVNSNAAVDEEPDYVRRSSRVAMQADSHLATGAT